MSKDDSKFNRKSSEPSGSVVENEVRKLFKQNPHHISNTAMFKLRERYGDQELLDQIQETFIERGRDLRKRAKKFAKLISERYSGQNYPLHILLKKALKYKKKYNLSDGEFEEFRRLFESTLHGTEERPQHVNVTVPFTNMSKTLGPGMVDVEDGMKFDDKDFEPLQKILRLYAENKVSHSQVVLQSMTYEDLAQQALVGEFQRERHNPHCHVHPVIAAMFLPKIDLLEHHMLHANLAYIVKQRYSKQPILTSTDYDVFYDLISDPSDVVCSSESPVKDLLNRAELQCRLWQSVIALRNGKYYDCTYMSFITAVDNCRRHLADNPDLIYEGDEGTILHRLLGAFSLRPTIVATTPLYNVLGNNPLKTQVAVPKVESLPFITLKLPSMSAFVGNEHRTEVKLEDAVSMSQYFIEDGTIVPKTQQVLYSKGVLIFYVPRRAHTLNIHKLVNPQLFTRMPRSVAGFDRLNDIPVRFETVMTVGQSEYRYDLRSVVTVDINTQMFNQDNKMKLITGCSTLIRRPSDGKVFWYNPRYANVGMGTKGDVEQPTKVFADPVSWVDGSVAEVGSREREDFRTKATLRGTIFVYAGSKEPTELTKNLIVF